MNPTASTRPLIWLMSFPSKSKYKVCGAFDTETTNFGTGADTRAFVVCYQVNDLRKVDISKYEVETSDDIKIYRSVGGMVEWLEGLIDWGKTSGVIPIVCGYNLMFDLETLRGWVDLFDVSVNAQTSTNVYTIDLQEDDATVLRFWDTYHLELNGLAAMGRTAGLQKLDGDWDYTLVRTPETPLTAEEVGYARRDVQVIPAYLRYLYEANSWLQPDMLGVRVITKSSIVRQMARHEISKLRFRKHNGNWFKVGKAFELTCEQEHAKDFNTYALRKACFRGGLTFTASNNASQCFENVYSLDVTSMHHLFINGRFTPKHFHRNTPGELQHLAELVLSTPIEQLLKTYWNPFFVAFHAAFVFENLRLKPGTVFDRDGIGTLATAKFDATSIRNTSNFGDNEAAKAAEELVFKYDWHDSLEGHSKCAFGKVLEAEKVSVFLSEVELYVMGLVYEWDSMSVRFGESTLKFSIPPDYVTLQSNILYEQKDAMKRICANYQEGTPYPFDIPALIPAGIADALKSGTASENFVKSYYNSTIKGSFNGVYGTQAQDVMKPGFCWDSCNIEVDQATKLTPENYSERVPKHVRVFFNYGLRIVGGSRLHLVLAMQFLYERFGGLVTFLGGDTDSLKVSLDTSIDHNDLLECLEPLHMAADEAINATMRRVREVFPEKASKLKGIGHYEVEPANSERVSYEWAMEAWNKCRICLENGHNHVTMAGVSRPPRSITVETIANRLYAQGVPFDVYAPRLLGYDTYIPPDITHALQKHQPEPDEEFNECVTDYLGNTVQVYAPQAVALYPVGRYIGEMEKRSNQRNNYYLRSLGVLVSCGSKQIVWDYSRMCARIEEETADGLEIIE